MYGETSISPKSLPLSYCLFITYEYIATGKRVSGTKSETNAIPLLYILLINLPDDE